MDLGPYTQGAAQSLLVLCRGLLLAQLPYKAEGSRATTVTPSGRAWVPSFFQGARQRIDSLTIAAALELGLLISLPDFGWHQS